MRKIIFVFTFSIICMLVAAQSNIRLNSYWDNSFFINPAYINEKNLAEFKMAARKQWVNFPGSPATLFASATTYLENINTQLGLRVVQDQIGYTSTTDINLTYAYSMYLNKDTKLHLGLAGSFQSIGYDKSKIYFESQDDPITVQKLVQENNFNANIGAEMTYKFWRFGFASNNIFSLFYPINKQFTNANFLYATIHEFNHDYVNLGYGVCAIQNANLYQMELNLTGYFKMTPEADAFQLGLFYRTWSEIGLIFGIDLTSNLKLTYSYDYNISGISQSSYGSHEIMISYRLDRVWRCKNCWY